MSIVTNYEERALSTVKSVIRFVKNDDLWEVGDLDVRKRYLEDVADRKTMAIPKSAVLRFLQQGLRKKYPDTQARQNAVEIAFNANGDLFPQSQFGTLSQDERKVLDKYIAHSRHGGVPQPHHVVFTVTLTVSIVAAAQQAVDTMAAKSAAAQEAVDTMAASSPTQQDGLTILADAAFANAVNESPMATAAPRAQASPIPDDATMWALADRAARAATPRNEVHRRVPAAHTATASRAPDESTRPAKRRMLDGSAINDHPAFVKARNHMIGVAKELASQIKREMREEFFEEFWSSFMSALED